MYLYKFSKKGKNSLYRRYINYNMNVSHMKNIIVLKDLPSNLIDEAIVILKSGNKIKNKEIVDNRNKSNFEENIDGNYEIAIKEAEFLVEDYIKKVEKPNENTSNIKKMHNKYKKLKICSLILGITTIMGILISIFK